MNDWVTVDHLTCEISRVEGIYAILAQPGGEIVNADEGELQDVHYHLWSKAAPSKMSVERWRHIRFGKLMPDWHIRIFQPDGVEAMEHCTLGELRGMETGEYVLPQWPEVRPIFFRYDCPQADVAYRLNEELRGAGYESITKLEKRWFYSICQVRGRVDSTRIFPWEFRAWKEEMITRATKFSSQFSHAYLDFQIFS